ncbi:uncharacterized protein G2W53_016204 [Senna tora]|uniref:Uncharacterized protein n=1 Tax=Senna tora TaxID=362788 RepID=A0A834TR23_9FABA|nr:uncharacterized protein G2W53_016204 [Senna tora]
MTMLCTRITEGSSSTTVWLPGRPPPRPPRRPPRKPPRGPLEPPPRLG